MNKIIGLFILIVLFGGLIYYTTQDNRVVPATPPATSEPKEITLAVGDTAEAGGLDVTLVGITEDSRCPANVQCIQAGTVRADLSLSAVEVSSGKTPIAYPITATTTVSLLEPAYLLNEYSVTLKKVTPERQSSSEIAPADYRLTFIVSELEENDTTERLDWDKIADILAGGNVVSVTQSHSLRVDLTLADGTTIVTQEPKIDAIFDALQECGGVCEDVEVATE
jgi:hypothetical protein